MSKCTGCRKIFLASASPRRAEILERAGIPFEKIQIESGAFEDSISSDNLTPQQFAEISAAGKLNIAVLAHGNVNGIILCADTIVACDEKIFGKPKDRDDAIRMLTLLSGREHFVITACAMANATTGIKHVFSVSTTVEFHPLHKEIIEGYIETGEPFDKAGAYGIQCKASVFVKRIEGCYDNVVGLPVSAVAAALRDKFEIKIESYWNKNH